VPKPSNRERILTVGLRVVSERGFSRASVRDIVAAAGVPQGSFTNHFQSKESFGLEVLDLALSRARATIKETLLNTSRQPLERLRAFIDIYEERVCREGSVFATFFAEAGYHGDPLRRRLVEIYGEVREPIAFCLRAAAEVGEVNASLDCDEVAGYIMSSFQGAIEVSKASRSPAPIQRFKRVLFSTILAAKEQRPASHQGHAGH
jgi:TetR/AcrR family transcriptional regulator, transcriptional repressor for nem operon